MADFSDLHGIPGQLGPSVGGLFEDETVLLAEGGEPPAEATADVWRRRTITSPVGMLRRNIIPGLA